MYVIHCGENYGVNSLGLSIVSVLPQLQVPIMHPYFHNIQLNYNKLVVYKEFYDRYSFVKKSEKSIENLKMSRVKGYLSLSSCSKIQKSINIWVSTITGYLLYEHGHTNYLKDYMTFCTLTLSATQFHDDGYIKRKMLDKFITKLKRKEKVVNYLWVAETQKNGNLHFHILVDRKINHKLIKTYWNDIQEIHGYIERYRNNQLSFYNGKFKMSNNKKDKRSYQQQYRAYQKNKADNFNNPNSTDIRSIEKMNNIAAYMIKYMTKGHNGRLIYGRLWGCSDFLKEAKIYAIPIDSELDDFLLYLENQDKIKIHTMDFGAIYSGISMKKILPKLETHYKQMNEYYYYQFIELFEN